MFYLSFRSANAELRLRWVERLLAPYHCSCREIEREKQSCRDLVACTVPVMEAGDVVTAILLGDKHRETELHSCIQSRNARNRGERVRCTRGNAHTTGGGKWKGVRQGMCVVLQVGGFPAEIPRFGLPQHQTSPSKLTESVSKSSLG